MTLWVTSDDIIWNDCILLSCMSSFHFSHIKSFNNRFYVIMVIWRYQMIWLFPTYIWPTGTPTVAAEEEDDQQPQSTSALAQLLIRKSAHNNDSLFIVRKLYLTLTVTFVFFVTLFIVYFSSMYSRCDLSTGIFYTNMDIFCTFFIVCLRIPQVHTYMPA